MLRHMVKKYAAHVQPNDLIRGLVGLKGLEPNEKIQELAKKLRAMGKEYIEWVLQNDSQTIHNKFIHSIFLNLLFVLYA